MSDNQKEESIFSEIKGYLDAVELYDESKKDGMHHVKFNSTLKSIGLESVEIKDKKGNVYGIDYKLESLKENQLIYILNIKDKIIGFMASENWTYKQNSLSGLMFEMINLLETDIKFIGDVAIIEMYMTDNLLKEDELKYYRGISKWNTFKNRVKAINNIK